MIHIITKVNYKVEQTRVGRQTNYDKLVMEVWTDGTIEAKDALEKASNILVAYFKQVFEPNGAVTGEISSISIASIPDGGHITVDELDLPTRIYNSLKNAGIETVSDLLTTPRKELMTYRNLGAKSLSIIEEALSKKGIQFNI